MKSKYACRFWQVKSHIAVSCSGFTSHLTVLSRGLTSNIAVSSRGFTSNIALPSPSSAPTAASSTSAISEPKPKPQVKELCSTLSLRVLDLQKWFAPLRKANNERSPTSLVSSDSDNNCPNDCTKTLVDSETSSSTLYFLPPCLLQSIPSLEPSAVRLPLCQNSFSNSRETFLT